MEARTGGERSQLRLAVIDVGGTMVAEGKLVRDAIHAALAEVGIPADPGLVHQLRGRNQREILAKAAAAAGLPAYAAEQGIAAFARQVGADLWASRYRLLPGVSEALARLRHAGVKVVATTNFAVGLRDPLLAVTGLAAHVEAAVSSEEVEGVEPEPFMTETAMRRSGVRNPAQVANIGDTARDLASGRAAGVRWNVGVLTGRQDRAGLQPQPGDIVVADLREAVARILGDRTGPGEQPV